MAHVALVISKEQLDLDSRFAWTSSLVNADFSGESVIILHNSGDTDDVLIQELTKLWARDRNKKFIYINSELSPLLQTFFFGLGGLVIDFDDALADADILISIIEDYRDCDYRVQAPAEKFLELRRALDSIIDGNLDPSSVYEIVTNADWRGQLKSTMNVVSSSLTVIDKSNHALVKFVDHTREAMLHYRDEIAKIKQSLTEATEANERARAVSSISDDTNTNRIRTFPPVQLPVHVPKVLYIHELSPCMFLTSFLMAYQQYLKTKKAVTTRLLIVQQDSDMGRERYSPKIFYNIDKNSVGKQAPATTDKFVIAEPRQDLMNYFFSASNCKCFIVLDRFLQKTQVIRSSPKVKMLYASNSVHVFEEKQIMKKNTIAPMRKDISEGGFSIPYLQNYNRQNAVGAYFQTCREMYAKLDSLLDFD